MCNMKISQAKVSQGETFLKRSARYIHTDFWGSPNTVSSLSGVHYFLTFTDDYSKKVWIYFLKTKDKVFQCFADWKVLVEN